MEFRKLGQTDLDVSLICLGTMTWGRQNTQEDGFEQMDYALERGINFFDTAEMYAVPPNAETYGKTETIIGNWFAARKNRDKVILASKVVGQTAYFTYVRNGQAKLDRANIISAVEDSLKRLQSDYIDLYQLHWPDRAVNSFGQLDYKHLPEHDGTPLLETLEVLGELVKSGKIRHIGLSNETPWGTMKFLQLAEQHGLPRMVSIQNPYNLINRTFEIGMSEVAIREQCGLLAYSPLGGGTISGKYLDGAMPAGSRRSLDTRKIRYDNLRTEQAVKAYIALAQKNDLDICQMAIAFVNQQEFVTSNIIGATTMAQLKTDIAAIDLKLSPELMAEIYAIHLQNPSPSP